MVTWRGPSPSHVSARPDPAGIDPSRTDGDTGGGGGARWQRGEGGGAGVRGERRPSRSGAAAGGSVDWGGMMEWKRWKRWDGSEWVMMESSWLAVGMAAVSIRRGESRDAERTTAESRDTLVDLPALI